MPCAMGTRYRPSVVKWLARRFPRLLLQDVGTPHDPHTCRSSGYGEKRSVRVGPVAVCGVGRHYTVVDRQVECRKPTPRRRVADVQ